MYFFDWRNYIALDGPTTRYNTHRSADPKELNAYYYDFHVEQLTEQMLDQLSAIPEIQTMLIRTKRSAAERLASGIASGARREDPRLVVSVNADSDAHYNHFNHTVLMGLKAVVNDTFGEQCHPFSLQRVFIHELFHASDPLRDNDDALMRLRQDSLKAALDDTYSRYPHLYDEYTKSKTLFGQPVHPPFNAANREEFFEAYQDLYQRRVPIGSEKIFADMPEPVSERAARAVGLSPDPELRALCFLRTSYAGHFERMRIEMEEKPAMNFENDFMARYFGEPPRENYYPNRHNGPHLDLDNCNYKKLLEIVNCTVHPAILPSAGIIDPSVIWDVSFNKREPGVSTDPKGQPPIPSFM